MLEGAPVNLVAHSHGTIIASRALREARVALQMEHGKSRAEAETMLGEVVRVVTTGNAAWSFPDGPKYLHVMNTRDGVSVGLGLGSSPEVDKAPGTGLLRAVGRTLALAGRGFRNLRGLEGKGTYDPGRDHQLLTFDGRNQPVSNPDAKVRNHNFAATYMPFLAQHRKAVMGTPSEGGFFLPASYRAPSMVDAARSDNEALRSANTQPVRA